MFKLQLCVDNAIYQGSDFLALQNTIRVKHYMVLMLSKTNSFTFRSR